jgi:hypothetical protein
LQKYTGTNGSPYEVITLKEEASTDCHHLYASTFEFSFAFHFFLICLWGSPTRAIIISMRRRRAATETSGSFLTTFHIRNDARLELVEMERILPAVRLLELMLSDIAMLDEANGLGSALVM